MELSRRLVLSLSLGLSLSSFACGDSADSKAEGNTTGSDGDGGSSGASGGGSNASTSGSSTGGSSTGGTSGGSTGASTGTGGCTGQGQQCMCSNGQMGFQACMNGTLGECTCGIDLSDAGLPPPSACPATATCQSTGGRITGVDGFCAPARDGGAGGIAGMIPPMCTTKADCDTAGLPAAPCTTITIASFPLQVCVQPCTPAP